MISYKEHNINLTKTRPYFFQCGLRGNRVDSVGSGSVSNPQDLPTLVESLTGIYMKQITCRAFHTAFLSGMPLEFQQGTRD